MAGSWANSSVRSACSVSSSHFLALDRLALFDPNLRLDGARPLPMYGRDAVEALGDHQQRVSDDLGVLPRFVGLLRAVGFGGRFGPARSAPVISSVVTLPFPLAL
jgi:hypothetical protein